jgi:hypothetical protein
MKCLRQLLTVTYEYYRNFEYKLYKVHEATSGFAKNECISLHIVELAAYKQNEKEGRK